MYVNDRLNNLPPHPQFSSRCPRTSLSAPPPIINHLPSTMIYYWHNLPGYNEPANVFLQPVDSYLMALWASILFSLEPHMIWLHLLPRLPFPPSPPNLFSFCFVLYESVFRLTLGQLTALVKTRSRSCSGFSPLIKLPGIGK